MRAPTVEGDFDLTGSPLVRDALPGLAAALDPKLASTMLESAVVEPGLTVEGCRPGKALYLGAEGCGLRYELEVRDQAGRAWSVLLLGRVLPDDAAAARYAGAVAARADGLGDRMVCDGVRHWAVLPDNVVVHRFPIDPELPTLADAVDARAVAGATGDRVPGLAEADVALGHYGRRDRCVLRYHYGNATVYGKVWSDDRGAVVAHTVARLEGGIGPAAVPRLFAYVPELRLALLDALAGTPALAAAMAGDAPTAARLVADAAAVAVALHTGELALTAVRTMEMELDELRGLLDLMAPVAPELAARFQPLLADITAAAAATDALPLVPTHGDFTPSQLLSDGDSCGLVDFDSMAQGEAALDLGQYLAYLRLAAAKSGWSVDDAEDLGRRFFARYAEGRGPEEADALRERAQVYGCVSLFRTTAHAWQKLKPTRAATVFAPLTREVACLPRG